MRSRGKCLLKVVHIAGAPGIVVDAHLSCEWRCRAPKTESARRLAPEARHWAPANPTPVARLHAAFASGLNVPVSWRLPFNRTGFRRRGAGTSARFLMLRLLRRAVRWPLLPLHARESWQPEVGSLHSLPYVFPVACDSFLICFAGEASARRGARLYLIVLKQKRSLRPEGLQ